LGNFAEVGLSAVDSDNKYVAEERYFLLTMVAGDYTANIHVEPNMTLEMNYNVNATALLSFGVVLYEVRTNRAIAIRRASKESIHQK
jgi:hypothetical protein